MILHSVARGDGPPVAILHGVYGQAGNFGTVQRRLAECGWHVLALDLRNHGASPHAPTMTYPEMADDVLQTLRAVGMLPCALIGHSMGGKVAMLAALTAPASVTRLLVADIAPVAYTHEGMHDDYLAAMAAVPLHAGLTRAQADAALAATVPDARTRGFLLTNFVSGATPRWRINLPAIAASLPALVGWPDVTGRQYPGPTLFLSGGRSNYVRAEYHAAIRALFPAARFMALPDVGHWVHADDPDGFVTAAAAFLGDGGESKGVSFR